MDQSMSISEPTIKAELNVSDILDDLLYRSSKPNPNREILVAASVGHKNCNHINKSQSRQRHPALLLSATKDDTSRTTSLSTGKHANSGNSTGNSMVLGRQSNNNYWSQYPSESEFDTTRIDNYLNALNLSRRHRTPTKPTAKQTGAKHVRSRSVDTTLTRLRMSIHKPVNSLINAITSPSGAKTTDGSGGHNTGKSHAMRNVLVTRSESLNSEGSSISGESVCCEFNSSNSHPAKSVLKKSSTASTASAVHLGPGKKNVTFSAFATIQVMDG